VTEVGVANVSDFEQSSKISAETSRDALGGFVFGRSARDLSLWQARPRGVAEFTISVAEFTKSSLSGQKLLQVSKILLIFVAKLLHTNDINTI